MKHCTVKNCTRPRQAKGLCQAHYMRLRYNGDVAAHRPIGHRFPNGTPIEVKMAESVEIRESGCHEWVKARNHHGYGVVVLPKESGQRKAKTRLAHRVSWSLAHGREPDDCVLHHCDNPPCVNPDHLYEGSQQDNMNDMHARGRAACWGHKMEALR